MMRTERGSSHLGGGGGGGGVSGREEGVSLVCRRSLVGGGGGRGEGRKHLRKETQEEGDHRPKEVAQEGDPPIVDRMTDTCKNITLLYVVGNKLCIVSKCIEFYEGFRTPV